MKRTKVAESQVNVLPSKWETWFGSDDPERASHNLSIWQSLCNNARQLRRLLEDHKVSIDSVDKSIMQAERNLDFEKPYNLVVVGESGAGKSTLLNALIGYDLMPTGSGGAVTGVAIYVRVDPETEVPEAHVTYRKEDEFLALLNRLLARAGLPMFNSLQEVGGAITAGTLESKFSNLAEDQRMRVLKDVKEIWRSYSALDQKSQLGSSVTYDPFMDKDELKRHTQEGAGNEKQEQTLSLVIGTARVDLSTEACSITSLFCSHGIYRHTWFGGSNPPSSRNSTRRNRERRRCNSGCQRHQARGGNSLARLSPQGSAVRGFDKGSASTPFFQDLPSHKQG